MKKLAAVLGIASLGLIACTDQAHAATATANLNVNANVSASCTINTAPVSFGSYSPTATTDAHATGSVTVACVKGTTPKIALSSGQNPGANPGQRAMSNGTDLLTYFLYKPALANPATCTGTETDVWGATGTELLEPGVATSVAATTYSICGKIPAQQDVATGTYQDTVIATVEF